MPGSEDADVQPSKSEVMRDAHDRPYIVNANGDVEMLSMDNLPLITPRRGEVNLDRVLSLYKERAEAWQKGKEREELENFLRGDIMGDDRNLVGIKTGPMNVDTCIGMGLGTFTANLPSPECSTTQPMDRLVALLFMVKVLGEKFKIAKVYIQDPVHNSLDEALLQSLDITILEDRQYEFAVTSSTLLYVPQSERTIIGHIFGLGQYPAVYIGSNLEDCRGNFDYLFVEQEKFTFEELRQRQEDHRVMFDKSYKPFIDKCDATNILIHASAGPDRAYWTRRKGSARRHNSWWTPNSGKGRTGYGRKTKVELVDCLTPVRGGVQPDDSPTLGRGGVQPDDSPTPVRGGGEPANSPIPIRGGVQRDKSPTPVSGEVSADDALPSIECEDWHSASELPGLENEEMHTSSELPGPESEEKRTSSESPVLGREERHTSSESPVLMSAETAYFVRPGQKAKLKDDVSNDQSTRHE